eukprot:gene245-2382_t
MASVDPCIPGAGKRRPHSPPRGTNFHPHGSVVPSLGACAPSRPTPYPDPPAAGRRFVEQPLNDHSGMSLCVAQGHCIPMRQTHLVLRTAWPGLAQATLVGLLSWGSADEAKPGPSQALRYGGRPGSSARSSGEEGRAPIRVPPQRRSLTPQLRPCAHAPLLAEDHDRPAEGSPVWAHSSHEQSTAISGLASASFEAAEAATNAAAEAARYLADAVHTMKDLREGFPGGHRNAASGYSPPPVTVPAWSPHFGPVDSPPPASFPSGNKTRPRAPPKPEPEVITPKIPDSAGDADGVQTTSCSPQSSKSYGIQAAFKRRQAFLDGYRNPDTSGSRVSPALHSVWPMLDAVACFPAPWLGHCLTCKDDPGNSPAQDHSSYSQHAYATHDHRPVGGNVLDAVSVEGPGGSLAGDNQAAMGFWVDFGDAAPKPRAKPFPKPEPKPEPKRRPQPRSNSGTHSGWMQAEFDDNTEDGYEKDKSDAHRNHQPGKYYNAPEADPYAHTADVCDPAREAYERSIDEAVQQRRLRSLSADRSLDHYATTCTRPSGGLYLDRGQPLSHRHPSAKRSLSHDPPTLGSRGRPPHRSILPKHSYKLTQRGIELDEGVRQEYLHGQHDMSSEFTVDNDSDLAGDAPENSNGADPKSNTIRSLTAQASRPSPSIAATRFKLPSQHRTFTNALQAEDRIHAQNVLSVSPCVPCMTQRGVKIEARFQCETCTKFICISCYARGTCPWCKQPVQVSGGQKDMVLKEVRSPSPLVIEMQPAPIVARRDIAPTDTHHKAAVEVISLAEHANSHNTVLHLDGHAVPSNTAEDGMAFYNSNHSYLHHPPSRV